MGTADYELIGSEAIAEAGFLVLRGDRFRSPAGEELTRYVVTHPGAVVGVPMVAGPAGPEVILVRQFRAASRSWMVELPAGKLDIPGEDTGAATERELVEEIGLRPARLVKLTEFWNSPGFSTELTHVYLALGLEPARSDEALKAEEMDMTVERVPLGDAVEQIGAGLITDAKTIIGVLLAERWLAEHPEVSLT